MSAETSAEELAAELYEVGMRTLGARYTFGQLQPDQREAWVAIARHVFGGRFAPRGSPDLSALNSQLSAAAKPPSP